MKGSLKRGYLVNLWLEFHIFFIYDDFKIVVKTIVQKQFDFLASLFKIV